MRFKRFALLWRLFHKEHWYMGATINYCCVCGHTRDK
jgi:hypothetical protein